MHQVSVRYSDAELAAATEAAGGEPLRPFIRDRSLSGAPMAARCGTLITPHGAEQACYEVRSAGALITSHNPETWEEDPRYPRAVQERDYKGKLEERAKVERIAGAPDPELVLALTPTPIDGPPVVSGAGIVLGGNGRTMGLRLAYKRGNAEAYRAELRERAGLFGLSAADVDAVPDPVLVRLVRGLDGASQPELAAASSRYNETMGNTLDERARAVSLSRRLSAETLSAIGRALDQHDTLRAAMAAEGPMFVRRLTSDGLITDQSRQAVVADAGGLTESGKVMIEGAFLGLVAGTPARLGQAAPGILQKVERLVPFLARVAARKNGHDLIPLVQAALDVLHQAAAAGLPVRRHAGQGSMFSEAAAPEVVDLAAMLEGLTSKRLAAAARAWAELADYDPGQVLMFGDHPTPAAALAAFFAAGERAAAA